MSEIEMKIKEHTEDIAKICEMLTRSLQSHLDGGIESADTYETGAVVDMIKDLTIAKEKAIKGLYYAEILEAMQGKQYGEEYDEDGPRFYRGRSTTTGRYMHRPYTEPEGVRVMTHHEGDGRMYYTESGNQGSMRSYEDNQARGYQEGQSRGYQEGQARGYQDGHARGYEDGREDAQREKRSGGGKYDQLKKEFKNAGNDKEKRKSIIAELLQVVDTDMTSLIPDMDTSEKQTVRNKLQAIQNKIS